MTLIEQPGVAELIAAAVREDLGTGDISTSLLPNTQKETRFRVLMKQAGVFAGREIALAVLNAYDDGMSIDWTDVGRDGSFVESPPVELAIIRGPLGAALSAERVLLNFLQRLSGIATRTRLFVDAVAGSGARILDTRKTTPGWRVLEKYAVRCGGGYNHRMGLYDAVLLKDNHFAGVPVEGLARATFDMLNRLAAAGQAPGFVEVEADTLGQLEQFLTVVGIDVVLLDNFSPDALREAVALRDGLGLRGKVALEASGGVDLDTVGDVAATGVDRISVGGLTHSATAVDLSLERI